MSEHKDKGEQGIVRTGRGEEQPVDKDRAQRATLTKHGPASSEGKDGEAAKKPSTSGHS
ncbi:MAG: hypothetical protein ACJ8EF_18150 [Bradyrhizobium sp.]|jgi:hypothetical protein